MLEPLPVLHSVLAPKALSHTVLPRYGLGPAIACQYYSGGFNDTYRVRSAGGETYYLRVYRSNWRTDQDVFCELDALDYLRSRGFPVAYPLRLPDQRLCQAVQLPEGRRYAALFVEAVGVEPSYDEDAEAKCSHYGQLVAGLHNALEGFTSHHRRFHLDLDHFIDRPLRMIEPFLSHRPEAWAELQAIAGRVRQRVLTLPAQELEWGFCHGDLQGYHHRIAPDGTMTFIDFDCGGFGYRAYDLAVFRWCARLSDKEALWWPPYLAGYQSVRDIRDLDVGAVPLFVACRYLWHIGVHCENAPDWGCGWLNDSYFDEKLGFLRQVEHDYGITG